MIGQMVVLYFCMLFFYCAFWYLIMLNIVQFLCFVYFANLNCVLLLFRQLWLMYFDLVFIYCSDSLLFKALFFMNSVHRDWAIWLLSMVFSFMKLVSVNCSVLFLGKLNFPLFLFDCCFNGSISDILCSFSELIS